MFLQILRLSTLKLFFQVFSVVLAKVSVYSKIIYIYLKNAEKQQLIMRKYFGEFFTDLSKAFDFLSEDLYNVKLNATTVSSFSVLKLDYAPNQKQITKMLIPLITHGTKFLLVPHMETF